MGKSILYSIVKKGQLNRMRGPKTGTKWVCLTECDNLNNIQTEVQVRMRNEDQDRETYVINILYTKCFIIRWF